MIKYIETFAQPVEPVKNLLNTPLSVKKLANSGLFDSFFALIGDCIILFSSSQSYAKLSIIVPIRKKILTEEYLILQLCEDSFQDLVPQLLSEEFEV